MTHLRRLEAANALRRPNSVQLDFSRPGKSTDHALIESFNARIRAECLNVNWRLLLEDVEEEISNWRTDYNEHLRHSALGNLASKEFASTWQAGELSMHQARKDHAIPALTRRLYHSAYGLRASTQK